MDANEFLEYHKQQFTRIEKMEERADMRAGLICSVIANVNRSKKSGKVYKITDFVKITTPKKKQTPDEMAEVCKMLTASFGGKVVK
jgi:hypothetical protein